MNPSADNIKHIWKQAKEKNLAQAEKWSKDNNQKLQTEVSKMNAVVLAYKGEIPKETQDLINQINKDASGNST